MTRFVFFSLLFAVLISVIGGLLFAGAQFVSAVAAFVIAAGLSFYAGFVAGWDSKCHS